jgi:hypothetical protein
MKKPQHWNEEELRRVLQHAETTPQPGDWAAMESLLDMAEEGFAALPDTLPAPGPALPEGWQGWLMSGLLSGLLLLLVYAAMPAPALPGAERPETRSPQHEITDQQSRVNGSNLDPARNSGQADMVSSGTKSPDYGSSSSAGRHPERNQGRPFVPGSGSMAMADESHPSPMGVHPVTATESADAAGLGQSILRPEVPDIRALPEDAYNTGLMAMSRLRRSIRPLIMDPVPPAIGSLPLAGAGENRWRFVVAAGALMAFSSAPLAAPLQPWLGAQVRYPLHGGWFLQSGIGAYWLHRRGYYGQNVSELSASWSPEETLSVRRADGVLVVQLPLLAGWQRGRWYGLGGAEVSAGIPAGPRQQLGAEDFQSFPLNPGLSGAPRNPDLGLTLGAGCFLYRHLSVEMRYHHGFQVFLPASAGNGNAEIRQRDLRFSLGWWW